MGEDLSVALVKAILEGWEKSEVMALEKYQELQSELGATLQRMQG